MKRQDRKQLLNAAGRLFRDKGFAASTIREIASESGMLPGSIHYRYSTKEELIVALMEQGLERAARGVQEAIESSRDPIERIRLAMRVHIRLLVSGDPDVYVLLYELRALTPEDRKRIIALRDTYEALWDGLLYAALGTGRLRKGLDIGLLRLAILGSLNWSAQWFRAGGKMSPDEVADTFWSYFSSGVLVDSDS